MQSIPRASPHSKVIIPTHMAETKTLLPKQNIGDPCRARTCNLRIRSPLLYPVELRGRIDVRLASRLSGSRPCGGRWRNCRRSRSAAGCGRAASARRPRGRCRGARRRRPPPRGVAKRSRTWLSMSPEPVQPISGSIDRAWAGTNSSTQSRVLRLARLHRVAGRLVDLREHGGGSAGTTYRLSPIDGGGSSRWRRGGSRQRVVGRLRGSEGWGGCTQPADDTFAACTTSFYREPASTRKGLVD